MEPLECATSGHRCRQLAGIGGRRHGHPSHAATPPAQETRPGLAAILACCSTSPCLRVSVVVRLAMMGASARPEGRKLYLAGGGGRPRQGGCTSGGCRTLLCKGHAQAGTPKAHSRHTCRSKSCRRRLRRRGRGCCHAAACAPVAPLAPGPAQTAARCALVPASAQSSSLSCEAAAAMPRLAAAARAQRGRRRPRSAPRRRRSAPRLAPRPAGPTIGGSPRPPQAASRRPAGRGRERATPRGPPAQAPPLPGPIPGDGRARQAQCAGTGCKASR